MSNVDFDANCKAHADQFLIENHFQVDTTKAPCYDNVGTINVKGCNMCHDNNNHMWDEWRKVTYAGSWLCQSLSRQGEQ